MEIIIAKAMFMHGTHSYYDLGVAMIDCVFVIDYTLHVWAIRSLRTLIVLYSTLGYLEKATETICC